MNNKSLTGYRLFIKYSNYNFVGHLYYFNSFGFDFLKVNL